MEDARLPHAQRWLSGTDGKPCAAQWRGNDQGNRSELWAHLAGLFRALSSVHESGIVHRRIWPANLLIDEGASRDQAGFLKLGRFEASTFFHQARRPTSNLPNDLSTDWYSPELAPSSERQVVRGTPAGDVYSLLLSALWLLTGRPDNNELVPFIQALAQHQPDQADRVRRAVLADAVGKLFTQQEREFFSALHRHRFSATTTAAHYHRKAEVVVRALRTANDTQTGPLCLVVSRHAQQRLDVLWTMAERGWRDWLTENGARGRFILGEQDPSARRHQATLVLPNGLVLLCSVFRSGSGALDWQRLVVADATDWTRPSAEASIPLAHSTFLLLGPGQLPPSNARSWRSIFESAGPGEEAGSLVHQVQQSLEQLNFAELAFWEQNVVPVVVRNVDVKGKGADREEIVHIDQLLDDPEHYPINPPIRQEQPPDFSTILQDKTPLIWVELSHTRDLWDRDKEGSRRIEPEYVVMEVPERGSGTTRSLRLHRELGPDTPQTAVGTKAYFKTEDQGWQMGVFYRRRLAIDSLPRHAVLSDILRKPVARQRRVEPAPLQLPYPSWSREKDRLVANTLATAPLFLVQGPPGTGKSTYITGLMRYVLSEEEDPGARLLVVAHMQHAVDDIYDRATARLDSDTSPKGWDQPLLLRLRPTGRDRDAERMGKEMVDKARQLFAGCLEVLDGRDDPVSRAAAASLALELQAPQPSRELQDRMIEAASIIFTTCTDRHLEDISRTAFDWVIIEEAGRLIGCDLVIPMRLGYRWVLIGDPEQIGPYRKEDFEEVVKRHLEQAVQEKTINEVDRDRLDTECRRLLGPFDMLFKGVPPDQREKLTQQHRMHPQICKVVSNVFYGGAIKDDPETAGKLAYLYDGEPAFLADKAVLWLDLPHLEWPGGRSTQEEREPGGYSYRNKHEADTLQLFLDALKRHTPANLPEKGKKFTLAALSPYKYQIQALRTLFRHWSCPEWLEVEKPGAFTSTSYQGREADIVLLSMVRNNTNYDMGFLKVQQMNVALSRARRLLVVVGCFEMLRHRAQSSDATDSFVRLLVHYLEPHVLAARDIFQEFQ